VDRDGNVFWVERLSHSVRKLEIKTGIITTIAGSGTAGFSGDGGAAIHALLNEPHSIAFDPSGNLFIADVKNHRVRKVQMSTGTITTFSGTGEKQATPDGAPISGTPLNGPRALDFDRAGNLWLALREGNVVLKFDMARGIIQHMAGTGKKGFTGNGGPAKEATLNGPKGLAVALNGNVYLADTENHAIRMIDVHKGTLELVAGTGQRGALAETEPLKTPLARPHGIFADTDGSIFIGDTEGYRILVLPMK
jgi:DNA-binding beta-propeller fold protein YncE